MDLKEQGMDLTKHKDWQDKFERTALSFAKSGIAFTSEDITARIGLPDSGINKNNCVGAMMSSLAKRKVIIKTGVRVSSRNKTSHGREICQWTGSNNRPMRVGSAEYKTHYITESAKSEIRRVKKQYGLNLSRAEKKTRDILTELEEMHVLDDGVCLSCREQWPCLHMDIVSKYK